MAQHWKGTAVFLGLLITAFAASLWAREPMIAVGVALFGITVGFVMAIARLRAPGHSPEHHPPSDRIVDDTRP